MKGRIAGPRVSITGLGTYAPEKIVTNDDLSELAETNDEWIRSRTGIRERRVAAPHEAASDLSVIASRIALANAGVDASEIDLVIVATVTPDMLFPATAALVAAELGMTTAAAYDLSAGCTGFVYALSQGYGSIASGVANKVLVVGADVLSRIVDWTDRATMILFGDGAGAVVLEKVETGGFLGFEVGADGNGGKNLWLPCSGSRLSDETERTLRMNGREVFKFATRIMISSAGAILETCDKTVADIDVYVPHQANVRIIDHAAEKLGIPEEKVVVNVDRYGNTSSGSIPLALGEAVADGRLRPGALVLMTGMGAGLTWGSALIEWTIGMNGATQ